MLYTLNKLIYPLSSYIYTTVVVGSTSVLILILIDNVIQCVLLYIRSLNCFNSPELHEINTSKCLHLLYHTGFCGAQNDIRPDYVTYNA